MAANLVPIMVEAGLRLLGKLRMSLIDGVSQDFRNRNRVAAPER